MSNQDGVRLRITNQIIEALRKGTAPWRRPWTNLENSGFPTNISSGRNYTGINPLLLELVAQERGYHAKWWGTFNQWTNLGGKIKKRPENVPAGEWGTRVVFYRPVEKTTKNENGEEKESKFFILREFTVFNVDQVDGAELDHLRARPRSGTNFIDYAPAERAIAATQADIRFGGNRAFYSRTNDFVQIPPKEFFDSQKEWYGTQMHELCHWAEKRVEWKASYAMNELLAEIGSCYLASEVGIPQSDDLSNHNAYLASWLKEFESDPKAIFRAGTQASKVANFIMSFSRPREEVASEEAEEVVQVGGAA